MATRRPDSDSRAQQRTMLAYERTRIASERTLMAWTRTAVALIGFGFSIPELFGQLQRLAPETAPLPSTARLVGIILLLLGILGLLSGIFEHVRLLRRVAPPGRRRDLASATVLTAFVLAFIGGYSLFKVIVG